MLQYNACCSSKRVNDAAAGVRVAAAQRVRGCVARHACACAWCAAVVAGEWCACAVRGVAVVVPVQAARGSAYVQWWQWQAGGKVRGVQAVCVGVCVAV